MVKPTVALRQAGEQLFSRAHARLTDSIALALPRTAKRSRAPPSQRTTAGVACQAAAFPLQMLEISAHRRRLEENGERVGAGVFLELADPVCRTRTPGPLYLRVLFPRRRFLVFSLNCSTKELPTAFLYISSFDPSRRAAAKAPSPKCSAHLYTRASFTVMIRASSRAERMMRTT